MGRLLLFMSDREKPGICREVFRDRITSVLATWRDSAVKPDKKDRENFGFPPAVGLQEEYSTLDCFQECGFAVKAVPLRAADAFNPVLRRGSHPTSPLGMDF